MRLVGFGPLCGNDLGERRSIEDNDFVSDAEKERGTDLSPEQVDEVREALARYKAGEPTVTLDEAIDHAQRKVKEWLPDQSA